MPYANLKAGTLLYDIRKQKPALNIKPGMFYNGLEGFSIKIDKKNDNGMVYFVLLDKNGKPLTDQKVDKKVFVDAFDYYRN